MTQDTLSFSQITTSTSFVDTPSWNTIDGLVAEDRYRETDDEVYTPLDSRRDTPLLCPTETVPPTTQSSQETIVQQPLTQDAEHPITEDVERPAPSYYSQPQASLKEALEKLPLMSSLPDIFQVTSQDSSFAESQQIRMERLRQELQQHEDKIISSSDILSHEFRKHAVEALRDGLEPLRDGLDSSQQLSHSLLDQQSSSRLALARPSPLYPAPSISSVSVDLTPLTEDLLQNSRTEYQSDSQTISDSLFPIEEGGYHDDVEKGEDVSNEIIETPLTDEEDEETEGTKFLRKYPELNENSTDFSTPPRVRRALAQKDSNINSSKTPVEIQSGGKTIGMTEIGSFGDTSQTSSLSFNKENVMKKIRSDAVKPLRRHAWSDSETENSLTRSSSKDKPHNVDIQMSYTPGPLETHPEKINPFPHISNSTYRSPLVPLDYDNTRLPTAPSSEKIMKFELPQHQLKSREACIAKDASDSSLDSKDYPNLKNSFVTLQNTIMGDIAALRRELLEKQDGTEKLRAEFADFKKSYYEKSNQKADDSANITLQNSPVIRSSPNPMLNERYTRKERSNLKDCIRSKNSTHQPKIPPVKTPTPPVKTPTPQTPIPSPPIMDDITSYSECDSDTDRQLATLQALQRSLREQSNARFLHEMEEDRQMRIRSRNESLEQELDRTKELDSEPVQSKPQPKEVATKTIERDTEPLDDTDKATREVFMEILRKKAELDEQDQKEKKKKVSKQSDQDNGNVRHVGVQSFTPRHVGVQSFTPRPRSCYDTESTLSTDTFTVEDEEPDLNALWKEFMRFIVRSKALKQKKSKKKKKCSKVDVELPAEVDDAANDSNEEKIEEIKNIPVPVPVPVAFDLSPPAVPPCLSPPDLKTSKFFTGHDESPVSSNRSREERINKLKEEIEEERQKRHLAVREEPVKDTVVEEEPPTRDTDVECIAAPSPSPPQRALAFDVSFDVESDASTIVERAPGYPNMVFKSGKLQEAFEHKMNGFIKKSRKRAIHIQLRKESRQHYADTTPPLRPRPTVDADHFTQFDIPPPRVKLISAREARNYSKSVYQTLPEVTNKKHREKITRQRETHRLRARLFNKKVQSAVLGRRSYNTVQVF